MYTSYMDDEKKQVLQLYGQRSDEATSRNANILCDIPGDIENPSILVTGKTLQWALVFGKSFDKILIKYTSSQKGQKYIRGQRSILLHWLITISEFV